MQVIGGSGKRFETIKTRNYIKTTLDSHSKTQKMTLKSSYHKRYAFSLVFSYCLFFQDVVTPDDYPQEVQFKLISLNIFNGIMVKNIQKKKKMLILIFHDE